LIDEYEFVVQPRLALPIPRKKYWTFEPIFYIP
jgi:hypothetical protein